MAEGVSSSMPMALRMVGDAIGLDSQNRKKEAYCQYLSCCVYISQILKDDAWDKDIKLLYNKDAAKLFKLIQQCQERALNIISSQGLHTSKTSPESPIMFPYQQPQTLSPPSSGNVVRKFSDPLPPRSSQDNLWKNSTQKPIDTRPTGSLPVPQYRSNPLKLPSPPSSPSIQHDKAKISFNQDMVNSYKPVDKRLTGIHMRFSYKSGLTDKNLSSMRKMTENLLIAKAREDAIRKKVLERQQRLQEEANRRFASAVVVSEEEQEQRLLYTKILEYEQAMVWPQQLRERLKRSPEDIVVINHIIDTIFSSKDHPLMQFLLQYQYHVYKKLYPLLKDVSYPTKTSLIGQQAVPLDVQGSKLNVGHDEGRTGELERQVVDGDVDNSTCKSRDGFDVLSAGSEHETAEKTNMDYDLMMNPNSENVKDMNSSTNESINDMCSDNETEEKHLTESLEEDASHLVDRLNENENLGQNEFIQETGPSQSRMDSYEADGDIFTDGDTISSIVNQVLEDILAQIVEDKDVGDLESDNLKEFTTYSSNADDGDNSTTKGHATNELLDREKTRDKNEDERTEVESGNSRNKIPIDPLETTKLQVDQAKHSDNVNQVNEVVTIPCNRDVELNRTNIYEKKALARIKSFDLESEFQSLEEDMFDSDSSEDEEQPLANEKLADHPADNSLIQDELSADCSGAQSPLEDDTAERKEEIAQPNKDENQPEGSHLDASTVTEADTETTKDPASINEVRFDGERKKQDPNDSTAAEASTGVELELTKKQLNEIFVDMRFFLEKLKGFIILAYEELATPTGHDQCYAAVEHSFFKPLWPLLLGVLRRVHYEKEVSLGCVMAKRIHDAPADMGVVDRLCLGDQEALTATASQYPYQLAIEQLHQITTCHCPLDKLECLVRALRGICQCVEDYWECKGKPRHCSETSIGCDDLLPVFCYVIIRSGMAQLMSESSAMEEFIPEGYLMGEEGYCLTTLQTALAYLVHLHTMDESPA